MSTPVFDHLRSQVMTLPESERAELARDLIKSLDVADDVSLSSEWELEIKKRISQIEAGTANLIDRNTFRRRMISSMKGL